MSLWKIALRSIQQRALASGLTGFSMSLGVALVVAVLVLHGAISQSFLGNSSLGYNLVIGATKGGRLDLVMNSVYYLGRPVENIPYSYYKEFTEGRFKNFVDKAIPCCLGDFYQVGERYFRVIGTTPAFLNELEHNGKKYEFAAGKNFEQDGYFDAVIGSTVAKESGLTVGSKFQPSHGVGPESHKHDAFNVVGVLQPTGTPNDRALFVNVEGFYLIPDHAKPLDDEAPPAEAKPKAEEHADSDHDHHEHDHKDEGKPAPLPEAQREVTSILVLTKSLGGAPPEMLGMTLRKKVNKESVAQAVEPIREMNTLFATFVDPLRTILLSLTVLIVIVSGLGILVSIYNSMNERRHEIAVMRALGAGRRTVMLIVLLESILLALAGGVLGWLAGHGLIAALQPWIVEQTGVPIGFLHVVPYELVIIPGLILLASLVGYLPALTAYRTDVAKALTATP